MKNIFILSELTDRKMRYYFMFLFTFLLQPIFSQSMLKYDTPAPEVGSLLRVQSLPVDLYSGRANVSIPLYSIGLKNYSYDIQLLYNSEGNKVDLPVGNVGLGWSVTGGQIYRVANGMIDEAYTFNEYMDRTSNTNWNQEYNLNKYYNPFIYNEDYLHEPDLDEFVISIGKINASFYMYKDKEGEIQTRISSQNSQCFKVKDVKIGKIPDVLLAETEWTNIHLNKTYHPKLYIESRPVLITEITIVDSEGVTYIFGGDINCIDLSCTYSEDPDYDSHYNVYGDQIGSHSMIWDSFHFSLLGTASTWHIKKIILPNQENIIFNYDKEHVNIVERLDHHNISTIKFSGENLKSNTIPAFYNLPSTVDPQFLLLVDKKYDIVYPSLLTGIKASNGDELEFVSSKRNDLVTDGFYDQQKLFLKDNYGAVIDKIKEKAYSYKLDEIKATTGNIKFYYTNQPGERLKLDSLLVNNTEKYKFQYNALKLPAFNQMLTDNWGYYNGKKYLSLINSQRFDALYNYRQPDPTYVKAEILEGIIYPTGGKVGLEYELHSYSRISTQYPFGLKQENGTAGGVRVKRITYSNYKDLSEKITKEYLYQNEDNSSSGILSVVPWYVTSDTGTVDYDFKYTHLKGPYSYSNKATTNINWSDGFHMGYSRVIEKRSDGSKTIYSFTNYDRVQDEPSTAAFTLGMNNDMYNKYTSRKLDRGLLRSADYYNASQKLIKKEAYTYHSDLSDYLKTIERYALMNTLPIRVSANKIYTYFPFLQKKETILYTDYGNINETEEYEYNKYRLLTATKKYTNNPNDNSILETRSKYLSDLMEEYDSSNSGFISSGSPLKIYDTMRTQGLLSYPVETVVKRNGKVTSAEVMTYKQSDKFAVQDKQYKLESDVPLSNYSSFKLLNSTQYSMDNRCALEMEYLDYDSYGNPTNVVDKTGINTAYIWGYNGQYPVAKVVNARNTFKSVPQYRDERTTKYVKLKYNSLSSNVESYNFYTSKAGDVEIVLSGALGFNWYVSGHLDNKAFNLVQVRSSDQMGRPWTDYQNAYTYSATFYVSAGYHTFSILSTDACKESSTSVYDGDIHFSYWTRKSIAPETSGADDVFYENFETTHLRPASFGYHSSNSCIGPYTVSLATNPEREYVIDYQVFKNGKWEYMKHDFVNGRDSINEGVYPIDDVRVYPKDASITTYGYYPLIGLRSTTNERGVTEAYRYDDFSRLVSVMDNDMNVIKKYDYFYQNQSVEPEVTYYNKEIRETFTRNTCDASLGERGESINYVVPAKKYSSTLSQEDANQKAYIDMQNNGQQYANEHAECNSNIIISVYNPFEKDYFLTFDWGVQGSIVTDYYEIPPSRKIADTGDVLNDYEPAKVYIPRRYYRNARVAPQDNHWANEVPSIKSTPYAFDINYNMGDYMGYEDTYVIGGYPFTY